MIANILAARTGPPPAGHQRPPHSPRRAAPLADGRSGRRVHHVECALPAGCVRGVHRSGNLTVNSSRSPPRAGELDELTSGTCLRSQWWIRSSRNKRKMFAVAEAAARTTPHLGSESCCSLCREIPSGDTMHHLSCGDLRCPSGRFEAVQAARCDGLLCVVQRSTRSPVRTFDLGFPGTDVPIKGGTRDRSYSPRAIRACSEPVSAEGSHEACAFTQVRSALHKDSREDVQKLLLRVRHDPAQVNSVRRLASVRGIHARELRSRDFRGVRPLQGGGRLRRGVLRVQDPELEAAVYKWLERAPGIE